MNQEKQRSIQEEISSPSLYLAPMEGVTTYVYRNAHACVYGPFHKYITPFLEPHEKRSFKARELDEILAEHNQGLLVVPQILTNRGEGFVELAKTLADYGYQEVNLNLGCPSKTVTAKGKGSGFLAYPEELDRFLEEIYSGLKDIVKISVKTRLGVKEPEEFERILSIFNAYPVSELIIHARVQQDFYKNAPRLQSFLEAQKKSRAPVCYNGDLFTRESIERFQKESPETKALMLGRGILVNPGLVSAVSAGTAQREQKEAFRRFHGLVLEGYRAKDMGDRNVLFKMKELWFYQIHLFLEAEKFAKRLKKVQRLAEYEEIVEELLEVCSLRW